MEKYRSKRTELIRKIFNLNQKTNDVNKINNTNRNRLIKESFNSKTLHKNFDSLKKSLDDIKIKLKSKKKDKTPNLNDSQLFESLI